LRRREPGDEVAAALARKRIGRVWSREVVLRVDQARVDSGIERFEGRALCRMMQRAADEPSFERSRDLPMGCP
jgi:hypothetical protein